MRTKNIVITRNIKIAINLKLYIDIKTNEKEEVNSEEKSVIEKLGILTFTILQIKDSQAPEAIGDDGEIGVDDAGIERARDRLREVQFLEAREPGGHSAEHEGTGTSVKLLPLGALQMEPSLADQSEDILVLLALQLRQHRPELVVGQRVVYGDRSYDVGRHWRMREKKRRLI